MLRIEGSGLSAKVIHEEPVLGVNTKVPSRREAQAAVRVLSYKYQNKEDQLLLDILNRFVETR